MDWLKFWEILAVGAGLSLLGYVIWMFSKQPRFWLWKGYLRRLTFLLAGVGIFAIGIGQRMYDVALPLTHASGSVEAVVCGPVAWTSERSDDFASCSRWSGYVVRLRTDQGSSLSLQSDSSAHLQTGARVSIAYEPATNNLVSAESVPAAYGYHWQETTTSSTDR
jgi:hypothetical protein